MERSAYDSLTPREKDCLRLVAQGLETKQIAATLTVGGGEAGDPPRRPTPDTVDGYIKSAMRKLGVSRRRDAARILMETENTAPQWLGVQPKGADREPPPPPAPTSTPNQGMRFLLPFRRRDEVNNELGIATRLLWIPMLAVGLAIGFGMLTSGLKVAVDLIGSTKLLSH